VVSEENVEIVRCVYEAAARHDAATVLTFYDPEVEFDFSPSPLGGLMRRGVYRGHEGVRRWSRERYESWEVIEDDCDELIDAGEQVVSVVTTRGRGRASGAEVEWTHHGVWTIRAGKIVRVAWFRTRDEALEAAGLEE
jgi:ketosteroid isomerase-like protein